MAQAPSLAIRHYLEQGEVAAHARPCGPLLRPLSEQPKTVYEDVRLLRGLSQSATSRFAFNMRSTSLRTAA